MPGSSKTWWENPRTDWTSGEPGRALELLARAYENPGAIKRIADATGFDWDEAPTFASARETWAWVLQKAARQRRVLDLIAEVLHDSSRAAFHQPLGTLLGDRLGRANARRVMRYGLPPPSEVHDAVLNSVVMVSTEPSDQPMPGLEAIVSATAGMGEPHSYIQALYDATRRTAMIQVAGQPRGTGLLVGADLVLTAAHVLDAHHWPPEPVQPAVAVFDYFSVPGRSPAETGTRVPVVQFVTGSLPTSAEVGGNVIDWDAPLDRLDFALLRLASAVPPWSDGPGGNTHQRGWYSLDPTPYSFTGSPILFILQHPLGEFQAVTFLKDTPRRNQCGSRIRYRGITLAGSSGSPVLDIRGRLVALHHYSQDGNNQGVPLSVITDTLLGSQHAGLFAAPSAGQVTQGAATMEIDPIEAIEFIGRPFVNRDNLRRLIRSMAEQKQGSPRTLAITGESGSGVSYSYMLASHIAEQSKLRKQLQAVAPGGLAAFKIDLRDYIAFGVEERRSRIIGDILVGLDMRKPLEPLAQDARNITTLRLWVMTTLRNSDRQWWIFFDSIDNIPAVKQGEVDELIHAMITVADDPQVPMRVVLAGREAEAFANEHTAWLERDPVTGLLPSDVEGWLRARADEEKRAIDEARLAAELADLFPDPGPIPLPERIAPRLPTILLKVLEGTPDG